MHVITRPLAVLHFHVSRIEHCLRASSLDRSAKSARDQSPKTGASLLSHSPIPSVRHPSFVLVRRFISTSRHSQRDGFHSLGWTSPSQLRPRATSGLPKCPSLRESTPNGPVNSLDPIVPAPATRARDRPCCPRPHRWSAPEPAAHAYPSCSRPRSFPA